MIEDSAFNIEYKNGLVYHQRAHPSNAIKGVVRSSVAWFENDAHLIAIKIHSNLKLIRGLNQRPGFLFKIMNYGLTGHQVAHYDGSLSNAIYSSDVESFDFRQLASLVIFLTDVPSGGEIVFLFLGVGVEPMAGSAVFWFNLHKD